MIPEERLTAYALNELDGPERAAVEAHLAADPAARKTVDAIRTLGAQLTASLAAEAEPAMIAPQRKRSWQPAYAALAASMLIAACVGIYAFSQNRVSPTSPQAKVTLEPASAKFATDGRVNFNTRTESSVPAPSSLSEDEKGLLDVTKKMDKAVSPLATAATPLPPVHGDVLTLGKSPEAKPAGPAGNEPKSGEPKGDTRGGIPADPLAADPSRAAAAAGSSAPAKGSVPEMPKPVPAETIPPVALLRPQPAGPATGRMSESETTREKKAHDGKDESFNLPPIGGYSRTTGFTSDRFPALEENAFVKVEGQAALSTFGVDVDTASYSIMRKFLSQNQMPDPNSVRLEEMVNYFPYRDAAPTGNDPFGVTVEVAECPWQPKHRLARIGLKAKPIAYDKRPPSNLVFLIDVSGSMDAPNRLPLVKASLKMLVNELSENDRVAMVVYAGASGLVLDSTSAMNKPKILDALDRLQAGGSTNGASGIELAYQTAKEHFIENGTNRVILCTDGDWNVGTTSTEALVALIEEKRKSNVFLSVFGFGMGNLKDEMMVKLAGKGNGQYYYVDNIKEARKCFVEQMGGTLVTVAKDVKIQVEFNPAKVGSYRLLGYEKRKLAAEDFHNDAKDAGEMGAGHVVTALYELTPPGAELAAKVDGLRYQKADAAPLAKQSDSKEAFVVKLRHKHPMGDVSALREVPVNDSNKPYGEASEDFRFAAAVASYAMLLRDSPHKGVATYGLVAELANAAKTWDPGSYRKEFVTLVEKAKAVSGKP